jgi:hypothetical protein
MTFCRIAALGASSAEEHPTTDGVAPRAGIGPVANLPDHPNSTVPSV